jgi:hypothetical protein
MLSMAGYWMFSFQNGGTDELKNWLQLQAAAVTIMLVLSYRGAWLYGSFWMMAAIVLVRGASFLTCPKSSMGINVVPGISMMRLLFKSSHNVVEGLIGSLQMFLSIIFLWCSI